MAALKDAARRLVGPLVLKGEGHAHKTEAGAVALNLRGIDVIVAAAQAMGGESWLLEEMVTGAVAELLVGVVLDPAHGYVLTLGAGGALTEILQDRASLLLPAPEADIRGALHSLRLAPLLQGYRGAPAADLDTVLAAVMALQDYVVAHHGEIEEVEINPLIVTPDRAIAADVLIRIGERDE